MIIFMTVVAVGVWHFSRDYRVSVRRKAIFGALDTQIHTRMTLKEIASRLNNLPWLRREADVKLFDEVDSMNVLPTPPGCTRVFLYPSLSTKDDTRIQFVIKGECSTSEVFRALKSQPSSAAELKVITIGYTSSD